MIRVNKDMIRVNKDMVRLIARYASGIDDKTCFAMGATCTWIRKVIQSDIDCIIAYYKDGRIDQRIMDRHNGVLKIQKSNDYYVYSDLKGRIEILVDYTSINFQNHTLTCYDPPAIIVNASHVTLANPEVVCKGHITEPAILCSKTIIFFKN